MQANIKDKLITKIKSLIDECNKLLNEENSDAHFYAFRTSAVSFLENTLGSKNIYCNTFKNSCLYNNSYNLNGGVELLKKIKKDVEEGWLINFKSLVSADIFIDFLEMAEYLLQEFYKDPAAVIIGSVLEENLRKLCIDNNIDVSTTDTNGKIKPNKAETMNIALCKAGVYNGLIQKSITAWLDLRNKAAHGKYSEYDLSQVQNLLQSVRDFASKYF